MTATPSGSSPPAHRLALDPSVRWLADGTTLFGGHPGRLLRLTPAGRRALRRLTTGGATSDADGALARRLVEAGMAHPVVPPAPPGALASVTVVVPVRDRSELLDRCLASLPEGVATVVVDDGSVDPGAVAAVCGRHGARLVTRGRSGGPAAARNDALAVVTTPLVALVDSDCVADPGWLGRLVGHFDDPGVAAVAPRVRPEEPAGGGATVLARYGWARSPLDLGDRAGLVGPGRPVRYVPTAALVVRRAALDQVGGFDPALRYGEDVDLVWRLVDRGWQVRYVPAVEVRHREPATWAGLLRRRFRYGTSAGPLARRHRGRLAPVELRPLDTAAALAVVAGRPGLVVAATVASGTALDRVAHPAGVPRTTVARWAATGVGWTLVGLAGSAATVHAPVTAAVVAVAAGRSRRRGDRRSARRAVLTGVGLAALPHVVAWVRERPPLDPVRWTAASAVDDLAYAAGVWAGCAQSGTVGPLVPVVHAGRPAPPEQPGIQEKDGGIPEKKATETTDEFV